ncbi:MAG TPA: NrsF family protein, partial [Rhizomicrobium sp.]|nr:NrsF family protein [Rhizomicrobium sp.]
LLAALRRLAPTRLTLAGSAAGLVAGAGAATVYGFHCTEMAAPFILIWYTLGIGLAAGLGAMLGQRCLHW